MLPDRQASHSNCPVISLSNIQLIQGGKRILDNVDWRVQPGEHWTLVGPNGSGKTTLLKVATGYVWPSAGSGPVDVLGSRFGQTNLRELRKRIGWASSALSRFLSSDQTPVEIVIAGLRGATQLFERPTESEIRQAREMLDWFGMRDAADRPMDLLSLGEHQKTILARALMPRPDLLILDEPCAGLDFSAREQLLEQIARLAGHCTLIYVTHHIEEISPVFSHTALLRDGRIIASGRTGSVLTSENLSSVFQVPIAVDQSAGRFWPRLVARRS